MKALLLTGTRSASSTRKLRIVLRFLLLVWAVGSAGVFGSNQTLAQNAYIANNLSDNVTVIDTRTNTVVGSPITVGDCPGRGRGAGRRRGLRY